MARARPARADSPADELTRCKEAALKRLAPRARSVEEVRSHLASKGFSVGAIETAIADLARAGLLCDDDLARRVADDTLRERPAGRALVDHRVRAREVAEPAAERAVEGALRGRSEGADALALARAQAPTILRAARADPHAAMRRLGSLLARRGFEEHDAEEAALTALRELGADPAAE